MRTEILRAIDGGKCQDHPTSLYTRDQGPKGSWKFERKKTYMESYMESYG